MGVSLFTIYTIGLIITANLPISIIIRCILASILIIRASIETDLHILRIYYPWSIKEAIWDQQGTWFLKFASGIHCVATKLLGNSLVTSKLVILNFNLPSSWWLHSLVLTKYNCDQDTLRRLQVRLKLELIDKHQFETNQLLIGGKRPEL